MEIAEQYPDAIRVAPHTIMVLLARPGFSRDRALLALRLAELRPVGFVSDGFRPLARARSTPSAPGCVGYFTVSAEWPLPLPYHSQATATFSRVKTQVAPGALRR